MVRNIPAASGANGANRVTSANSADLWESFEGKWWHVFLCLWLFFLRPKSSQHRGILVQRH